MTGRRRWTAATVALGVVLAVTVLVARDAEPSACERYADLGAEGTGASSFEEDQRLLAEGYARCLQDQVEPDAGSR